MYKFRLSRICLTPSARGSVSLRRSSVLKERKAVEGKRFC